MKDYKEYFKGKKVTMLGLGLLGRGLNDAKLLAECGADLIITDLKTAEDLAPTLKKLSKYKDIKYILGEHRLEDFKNRDFILKAAGVPLDSPYINEAKKNNIPVEMDESLFVKVSKDIKIVGVTGTRGKTTTTYLIYEILKKSESKLCCKVYLGGNIKGLATLPLLKKVKPGDIVVMELSSWQLQGFGDSCISPDISVFTNLLPDHLNYYLKVSKDETEATQKYFDDKSKVFCNQKKDNYIILNSFIKKEINKRYKGKIESKIIMTDESQIKGWKFKIKGEHNIQNILQAIEVAKILGINIKDIKRVVENFSGVEGRQEFLREHKGVKIYNDTTATTPDATVMALRALGDSKKKNVILIMGGADKNLDMSGLIKEIPKYCKKVILLAGTGTEKLGSKIDGVLVKDLKTSLLEALKASKKGDILVLSPAFASFGMFKNEFDRGDQFVRLVKRLK
ncbi:MAG: UDP-N-acetylmuramoyl-L-alanine--D-glutamate ligase [Candidatus Paceibacterota bacterium]|jgi:UDP-N-acetylmuramoylalanine--D-glutamate ligase